MFWFWVRSCFLSRAVKLLDWRLKRTSLMSIFALSAAGTACSTFPMLHYGPSPPPVTSLAPKSLVILIISLEVILIRSGCGRLEPVVALSLTGYTRVG